MNCLMKLPWSAGVYKENKRYYPQDRVLCDGSVYVSLAEQTGNRPSFTVTPDGMYEVSAGWGLLAPGLAGSSDGMDYSGLLNKPRINGVELIGNKTAEELGLATAEDIPDTSGLATKSEVERIGGQAATNAAAILRKVDKVEGRGLSSNDYTDADKAKVAAALTEHQSLAGYAKTAEVGTMISEAIAAIPPSGREVVKTNADTIGFGTSYAADTPSVELAADKFHIVGRVSRLALTLPDGAATDGKEYICQFFVGENSASYTLTLPDTVVWLGGDAPVMESEACYMLSIVNHCAVCGVFKQSA